MYFKLANVEQQWEMLISDKLYYILIKIIFYGFAWIDFRDFI